MVKGADQQGRCRIVHDQGDTECLANGCDLGDREDFQLRIGQGFGVIGAGLVIGGAAEILRIGRVDEADFDALILQRVGKQVPGATIKSGGGNDVVAGPRQVLDGIGRGCLSRCHGQGPNPALQGRNPLFQHIGGRVHQPGIDIPQFLQGEQRGSMAGVMELIGSGLVDRHGHRPRRGVGAPSSV